MVSAALVGATFFYLSLKYGLIRFGFRNLIHQSAGVAPAIIVAVAVVVLDTASIYTVANVLFCSLPLLSLKHFPPTVCALASLFNFILMIRRESYILAPLSVAAAAIAVGPSLVAAVWARIRA